MKKEFRLPTSVAGLSPLELARKIPLAEAAAHNGIHADTFKKAYAHLLRQRVYRSCGVVSPSADTS